MSADNWRVCPKCKAAAETAHQLLIAQAKGAYGKVSEEEYRRVCEQASKAPQLEETLREDYEIGTGNDGLFYVNYGCTCEKCGFTHRFEHNQKLNLVRDSS